MRKLVLDHIISLDGYFTSPKNEIDWFEFSDEEWAWSRDILRRAGAMLYGRVTYEEFRQFWPTSIPKPSSVDPELIRHLNDLPKIIFSKTLAEAPWGPAQLMRDDPIVALKRLKNEQGRDLVLVGSGTLAASFVRSGLVDEYFIRVRPVILGAGRPLFVDPDARHSLKLLKATAFKSGVVGLHYEPAKAPSA